MTTIGGLATTIKSLLHRSSILTNKTLVGRRCMSKVAARWDECYYDTYDDYKHELAKQSFRNKLQKTQAEDKQNEEQREESCWIPDPRTGIYYPKGHEWVMKDIPDGAATFTYSYWFRNSDSHGV